MCVCVYVVLVTMVFGERAKDLPIFEQRVSIKYFIAACVCVCVCVVSV